MEKAYTKYAKKAGESAWPEHETFGRESVENKACM
jgi:hypothetical protein